ncbi:MAG: alanine racemase [Bacteroidota bacterium]
MAVFHRPTLLLDEAICRKNIKKMVAKAQRNTVRFRPHFKTHQSQEIARWFRQEGVNAITVSSVAMAQYFAEDGWKDITIAFPVNLHEIQMINDLADKIQLNLLVESLESIHFLDQKLSHAVHCLLKVDLGYGRTGIDCNNLDLIDAILQSIASSKMMQFVGFLGHAGQSYSARSVEHIRAVHQQSIKMILGLKAHYQSNYPNLQLSVGDTPTCSRAEDFGGVDEIRPGNFVFYDVTQHFIGSNTLEEIAVAMTCPIVARHSQREEIIIYGGGAHFSKDRIEDPRGKTIFGLVVENRALGWGPIIPGAYVKKLSQEHGTIHLPATHFGRYQVGDWVTILPVHSCMCANLMKAYWTTAGQKIDRL